jgi:glutaredoxin 3
MVAAKGAPLVARPKGRPMTRVEMYAASWCVYCVRAQTLLDRKGVPYTYIDVDERPEARLEMRHRGGGHTIPQIFIDNVPIGGSDDLHALDRRGALDRLLVA